MVVLTPVLWGSYNYRTTSYRRDPPANFCSLKLHYRGLFISSFLESSNLLQFLLLSFSHISYSSKTVEAERISVDHVAHLKPSDGGSAATQRE